MEVILAGYQQLVWTTQNVMIWPKAESQRLISRYLPVKLLELISCLLDRSVGWLIP